MVDWTSPQQLAFDEGEYYEHVMGPNLGWLERTISTFSCVFEDGPRLLGNFLVRYVNMTDMGEDADS